MRIRSIYLGAKPIILVYQNGKLIQKYDNSVILWGIAESNTIALASVLPADAIVIDSDALSKSETTAPLMAFDIARGPGIAETATEVDSVAWAVLIKAMTADAESASYTKATGYADNYISLGPVNERSKTYTLAQAYSHRSALSKGETHSETEAFAKTLHFFSPQPFAAESIDFTYAEAEAYTVAEKYIGSGSSESTSNTMGNLTLWLLPAVENNVLKIEAAYDATLVNGILEVV